MCQYSSQDAADALGVSVPTIHSWINKGLLSPKYIGLRKIVRFDRGELERFAEERQISLELPEKE